MKHGFHFYTSIDWLQKVCSTTPEASVFEEYIAFFEDIFLGK